MEVVIGLTDGFVHASAVVVLTFASVIGKIVLDGKSKENLEKIVMHHYVLVTISTQLKGIHVQSDPFT